MCREETGKCAFGPGCNKIHAPHLLSVNAQKTLRDGNIDHHQQLTLHLASVPEGYEEEQIYRVCLHLPQLVHLGQRTERKKEWGVVKRNEERF